MDGDVFDDNWNNTFNKPEGIAALKFFKEVSDTGPAGIPGYRQGEMMNAYLQGQSAMFLDSIVIMGQVNDPVKSKFAGKVGYALHPTGVKYAS